MTNAKATFSNIYTIVVAPWRYVDEMGSSGAYDDYAYIGDSEDQDVIFVDSVGNKRGLNNAKNENVTVEGYLEGCFNIKALNCIFVECANVLVNRLIGCRLINSNCTNYTVGGTAGHLCASSAFINSPVTLLHSNPAVQMNFSGCYFDSTSTLNNVTPNICNLTGCHFANKMSWDIPTVNYGASNTDGDPYIYDADLLNYSIDPLNSPLFGRGYPDGFSNPRHLARYYIGTGFYTGQSSFDSKVAANPNLDVVANELLNIGANDVEFIETDEVTLPTLQALGVPHKVGIITYLSTLFGLNPSLNSLDRVLEIRYSSDISSPLGVYKKYRFGEQATNDSMNLSNGDPGYSWANNTPIFVKKFQARIGVVKPSAV